MNRRRSTRTGLILVAALIVAAALGGGYAWGHTSAAPSAPVAQSSTAAPAPPSKGAAKSGKTKTAKSKAPSVQGPITAINGDAWTVQTTNDGAVSVTVGGDTKYGTEKAPAVRSDFTVGKQVVITGVKNGNTVAATRIAVGKPASATPAPATPASPTPTR
ncbi:MAG: DUF5666 domain-containing protein [Actinomycetota bacterium]|nr:DUF5666 domain-containing protein [Actinomycetota bacterium]